MTQNGKSARYFKGCNERLLSAVPATARHILDVGCGEGQFGAALKKLDPERVVWGIESNADAATAAAERLDKVFTLDVENVDPPVERGSIDCVVFGEALEHLISPGRVLRQAGKWLAPGGVVLCSVPNVQHHSIIAGLFRSDFQYTTSGLLHERQLRFFTYSTLIKLFLDAGFEPEIVDRTIVSTPTEFLKAAEPLLKYLDLQPSRTSPYLDAYEYIFKGTPLPEVPRRHSSRPLTFVVCVSNDQLLQANLLASPCLGAGTPHEVLLVRNCRSAAEGLDQGIRHAKHEVVVCVHQDVYLPDGWVQRFWEQYDLAQQQFASLGVLGVYGIRRQGAYLARAGYVVARDCVLKESEPLPVSVESLDEMVLAIPKGVPVEFDPALGFHFYGADACLQARKKGLHAVAIDALCFHNSRHVAVAPQFHESGHRFATKWASELPLVTSCAVIDSVGILTAW